MPVDCKCGSTVQAALKLYKLWCHIKERCVIGYVTAIYDGACAFLHPRGPSRSFLYPHKADILTVHISDIPTFVEPTTYTGRTYTLTDNEMDRATQALQDHK